ncbi:MAG TPA: tungsten ABC transporter substrate-binding protein, partial [Candidatus Ozemobacteraceae bacterium]|nr:tungsten ABC transporter substrate-binding protein [Candidatus Ozemobacteraceae bacterium]
GGKMTGANYLESGQGMSEVLVMAGEKKAYTLTDRATWLTMRKKLDLVLLYQNPPELKNSYAVIAVSNAKVPTAKTELAKTFVEWVTSPAAQSLIASYTLEGDTLFYLSVGKR